MSEPDQIPHSPSLSTYAIHTSSYLSQHPQLDCLAACGFIFTSTSPRKLLLIQRAVKEPAFPNLWECPSGGVESSDTSILHALAREIKEEVGLIVSKVVKEITLKGGENYEFKRKRKGKCRQICFIIEVESSDDVKLNPVEHQTFEWCDKQDVEGLELTTREVGELIGRAFDEVEGGVDA